jgi:AraC-like DNA-binding protein/mannose-6-phosphate isomerase-like protein (cupin superfamily)
MAKRRKIDPQAVAEKWDRADCLRAPVPSDAWTRTLERGLSELPVLHDLATISVGDIWAERFHSTPTNELLQVREGHAQIAFKSRSFDVAPGDTFVIPRGTPHRDIRAPSDEYRVIYVFFSWPAGEKIVRGLDPQALTSLPESPRAHLHLLMKALENEYLAEDEGAAFRARVILLEMLLALARYCRRGSEPDSGARQNLARERRRSLMTQVRAYLQESCARPVSLEALAARFDVSPYHLCRSFSQEFGISLFEMLTLIRMDHARELLRDGRLSIKEIAARVGFGSSNYFAKVFRRSSGISPTEFQAKLRRKK